MVCLGNVCINTLHKGDSDDDDVDNNNNNDNPNNKWDIIVGDNEKRTRMLIDVGISGESSCNSVDGTDQRVQFLMFMMMMNFWRQICD